MQIHRFLDSGRALTGTLFGYLVTSLVAAGQTAPTSEGKPADEKTIELSPFVVSSDKDLGYLAGNSLSGSRMDLKLKDTAASISVLTEEFIRDIGATNLTEIVSYT